MQASWMILASLFFATMSVCIKYASAHFGTFELVFYRGVIGMVFMTGLCRMQGVSVATRIPMMHLWRSVIGVASLSAWFYAIAHMPLATAMTLNYMSGVWVAAFLVGGTLVMGRLQDAGRQALLARGDNEVGPYQSPMEDGMQHFHEWYRRHIGAAQGALGPLDERG